MLNLKQTKFLVRNYFHEACSFLNINDKEIPIFYMKFPVPIKLILLSNEADFLSIDINVLRNIVRSATYTVLRLECYMVARAIYNHRKCTNKLAKNSAVIKGLQLDEYAFAYTLGMLLGLRLNMPDILETSEFFRMIENIASVEFHEDCRICSSPSRSIKNRDEYFLSKKPDVYNKLLAKYSKASIKLYVQEDGYLKGSITHPFDNVNDAADFILSQERKAFVADEFMQNTLLKRKFNYALPANMYNIPWADAYVAWIHPEVSDDSFLVNHLKSGRFSLKPNMFGRKFLYRGQSEYYDICVPSLFRDKNKTYFLDDMIRCQEFIVLCQSHPLVRLLDQGIDLWNDIFRFEMNYGGLAQHYYNKTSFLDLTSDIEAAKFFAVTDYDRKTDTYKVHDSTEKLGVLYYYEISMPQAFQRQLGKALSTIGKQVFMRSGQQHGYLLNMNKGTNFNEFPEVHKVFFRHIPPLEKEIFKAADEGEKYFPSEMLQSMWMRKLKHHSSVVSLSAVKINVEWNKGETIESVVKKLRDFYDIEVKDYIPKFDDDLIDQYYDNMAHGWWQDVFCHDICFGSSDGVVYKDFLNNVPSDPRYQWAFKRK